MHMGPDDVARRYRDTDKAMCSGFPSFCQYQTSDDSSVVRHAETKKCLGDLVCVQPSKPPGWRKKDSSRSERRLSVFWAESILQLAAGGMDGVLGWWFRMLPR